ncbi:MAG: hypothetical protein JKY53_09555 [Flavobacteriales bacterium]|nr:hypothetical protein [Flavobacteriales bacterium]
MRKLSTLAIFLLATTLCFAQQDTAKLKRHTVYVELAGVSFIGATLNYEYTILKKGIFRIQSGLATGLVYYGLESYGKYGVPIIPSLKVLIGKKIHFGEIGVFSLVPDIQGYYLADKFF